MKGIILFASKYGSSEKYAKWLSEETGFDCVKADKADSRALMEYDTVILGGGIYAGRIAGLSVLKKNMNSLKGRKLAVYCCGASEYDEGYVNTLKEQNFKDELLGIPCFYLRGAFDMNSLKFGDRTLCKMLAKVVSKKDPDSCEVCERAILEARDTPCDWTDRASLKEITDYIKSA
ncbi:flavodoxin domain-containing protein [Ruminococcus sp. NK3A76]|uniref:flavodoxin domain-containing protein n=1 Tax=Ruminococcus sp. NK3A76 TaxID=877411 RepID=UPI00048CADF2|nr:flavodoxin domain-containing protein [Ruminococcus sp. NK3A76]